MRAGAGVTAEQAWGRGDSHGRHATGSGAAACVFRASLPDDHTPT